MPFQKLGWFTFTVLWARILCSCVHFDDWMT